MQTGFSPKRLSWYAAYTYPRHEKKVANYLDLQGIEVFLPLYRSLNRWRNGVVSDVKLPLFPGYVFAKFCANDRLPILEAPGLVNIVGSSGCPAQLSEQEIESLRSGLTRTNAEPHPFLKIGDRVRMKSGPMCGLEGVVLRVKNSWRLIISLDLLMKAISVEVDFADMERLSGSNAPQFPQHRQMAGAT
jgi:transcription antitermination factor NusG